MNVIQNFCTYNAHNVIKSVIYTKYNSTYVYMRDYIMNAC